MTSLKIVDLFAGCGGFSCGFEQAGFSTELAIEIDLWASDTYRANHAHTTVLCADIHEVNPLDYVKAGLIDGIIGGPPCQGFSLSGNRDAKDPRNSLFMEFVRWCDVLRPKFFVMENVTGILSMTTKRHEKVVDIIRQEFEKLGYALAIKTLNAADFGVPQARQRVFFFGIREDVSVHASDFLPQSTLTQPVTLWDAISDLPQLQAGEGEELQAYAAIAQNEYQTTMRSKTGVRNHIAMRHTARIIERFKQIGYGQSVKDVDAQYAQRKRGDASIISGKTFSQNNMRPHPDRPAPTVPASFQSNFIHPFLNRNFTAREGARLQSFPDDYVFLGKRTTMSWEKHLSQYQQIGNAVPPLLARAIALALKANLERVTTNLPTNRIAQHA